MGIMFSAFFAFFTQLFSAAEKGASALNHLGTWADEAAGTFADEARHNRNERIKAMLKEANITELPKAPPKAPVGKLTRPATPVPATDLPE